MSFLNSAIRLHLTELSSPGKRRGFSKFGLEQSSVKAEPAPAAEQAVGPQIQYLS